MKLVRRRGQSIGEYAILFAIVLGAVVAMQNYIRNRIAGAIKVETDAYFNSSALWVNASAGATRTNTETWSNTVMTNVNAGNIRANTLSNQVITDTEL